MAGLAKAEADPRPVARRSDSSTIATVGSWIRRGRLAVLVGLCVAVLAPSGFAATVNVRFTGGVEAKFKNLPKVLQALQETFEDKALAITVSPHDLAGVERDAWFRMFGVFPG